MTLEANWLKYLIKLYQKEYILKKMGESREATHRQRQRANQEFSVWSQSIDFEQPYNEFAVFWLPKGTCTWEKRGSQVVVWKAKLREN